MKPLNWFIWLAILGLFFGGAAASENQAATDAKTKILEERINDLKAKIFRTKARILHRQEGFATESIPAQAPAGAGGRAVVKHVNQMGDDVFKLISVRYLVDAQPIFQNVDPGELAGAKEIEVFNKNIGPGSHRLSVQMVYQALPVWGFSYVEAYKFKVSSSYEFTAEQGKIVNVRVVGFDKGSWLSRLEDRPSIKYDVAIEDQGSTTTPAN